MKHICLCRFNSKGKIHLSHSFLCLKTNVKKKSRSPNNSYLSSLNYKSQSMIFLLSLTMLQIVKPKQPQDVSLISSFEISLESSGIRGNLKQINK